MMGGCRIDEMDGEREAKARKRDGRMSEEIELTKPKSFKFHVHVVFNISSCDVIRIRVIHS